METALYMKRRLGGQQASFKTQKLKATTLDHTVCLWCNICVRVRGVRACDVDLCVRVFTVRLFLMCGTVSDVCMRVFVVCVCVSVCAGVCAYLVCV